MKGGGYPVLLLLSGQINVNFLEGLGNNTPHFPAGAEGAERILKNRLNLLPVGFEIIVFKKRDIFPLKKDLAFRLARKPILL